MTLLKGSWFFKIASLFLAILTYVYIHYEITSSDKKVSDPSYRLIKLTARSLPIRVRLATSPPEGYRVVADQVMANPKTVFVIGPEALLESASSVETALMDVGQNTQTVVKKIPLESIAGIPLSGEAYNVEVSIPIEKS